MYQKRQSSLARGMYYAGYLSETRKLAYNVKFQQ